MKRHIKVQSMAAEKGLTPLNKGNRTVEHEIPLVQKLIEASEDALTEPDPDLRTQKLLAANAENNEYFNA